MLMIAPTVTAINGQRSGPGFVVFLVQAANFGWRLHRDANRLADDCVDSINPQDLAGKYFAEIAGNGFGYGVHGERLAELLLH